MSTRTQGNVALAEKKVFGLSYPVYVNTLLELGMTGYEVRVADQSRQMYSVGSKEPMLLPGFRLHLTVNDIFNEHAVKIAVYRTQTGQTDYPAFLTEIAEAGVHHYFADLLQRTVTYYNEDESRSYVEAIL